MFICIGTQERIVDDIELETGKPTVTKLVNLILRLLLIDISCEDSNHQLACETDLFRGHNNALVADLV